MVLYSPPHTPLSASLLCCEPRDLERALLTREVKTGNESIVVPMSHSQAVNSRDTLAMLLYSRLFDWCDAHTHTHDAHTHTTRDTARVIVRFSLLTRFTIGWSLRSTLTLCAPRLLTRSSPSWTSTASSASM